MKNRLQKLQKSKKAFSTTEYVVIIILSLITLGILFSTFGQQQSIADKILIILGLKTNNIDRSFNERCGFEVKYIDLANDLIQPSGSCSLAQNNAKNKWICLGSVHLHFKIGVTSNNEKTLTLNPVALIEQCKDETFSDCKKVDEIGALGTGKPVDDCSVPYSKTTDCFTTNSEYWVDFNLQPKQNVFYYRIKPKIEAAKDTCLNTKIETAQKDDSVIFVKVFKTIDLVKTKEDCLTTSLYYTRTITTGSTIYFDKIAGTNEIRVSESKSVQNTPVYALLSCYSDIETAKEQLKQRTDLYNACAISSFNFANNIKCNICPQTCFPNMYNYMYVQNSNNLVSPWIDSELKTINPCGCS